MAHIIFAHYGHPSSHKKLKSEINNWRYERTGLLRKGATAPIISEIKFYDVRIPKENVPDFCRDLNLHFTDKVRMTKENRIQRMHELRFTNTVQILINAARRLFGLKSTYKTPGPQRYKLKDSWHYSYLIGVLPDPEQEDRVLKTKREIL